MMRRPPAFSPWYLRRIGLFFIAVAVMLLAWPIVGVDCDLWYHLTGGAYIVQHHALPNGPFFSFVETSRPWIVYYWLFQVLVYAVNQLGGDIALIVLRMALFVATIYFVYSFMRADVRRNDSWSMVFVTAVTCAYAMSLFPRELDLRPHCVTYLCIVVMHHIVNHRPKQAWLLPVVALLWVNLHGMLYPILVFLCGAYLAEHFLMRMLKRQENPHLRAARWPLIVSLYMVLLTPVGTDLLPMPFQSPPYLGKFVQEMFSQPLDRFLSFSFFHVNQWMFSAVSILVVLSLVAAGVLATRRRLRLSRIILLAGALYLLPQSRRYYYEYVLMVLPLLGDFAAFVTARRHRVWPVWATQNTVTAILIGTVWVLCSSMGPRPQYPLERSRLPLGACAFLEKEGPGGNIFNVPTPGGYMQWRLYPKYRIYVDMQTMLFTTQQYFTALSAFSNKDVLASVVKHYTPGFFVAYGNERDFKKLIAAYKQYKPVFFDDVVTVYADDTQYPDLVKRFRLEFLDSLNWQEENFDSMPADKREKALAECRRLLDVYPQGLIANTIAAKLSLAQGRPQEADAYAEAVLRNFPDRFMGYALKGLIAFREQHYDAALDWNQRALRLAGPAESVTVRRNVYASYVRLKDFRRAYKELLDIANPMAAGTGAKDLFDLSLAAVACGRNEEGAILLSMAKVKAVGNPHLMHDIEDFEKVLPH